MANLYSDVINTNGEYANIETLTELTFTADTQYQIQMDVETLVNKGGHVFLREGATGTGFSIKDANPVIYTDKGNDLYILTTGNCYVNIAS